MICVYFMTGAPEGSTESGSIEKLGIEHATLVYKAYLGLSPTPRWRKFKISKIVNF